MDRTNINRSLNSLVSQQESTLYNYSAEPEIAVLVEKFGILYQLNPDREKFLDVVYGAELSETLTDEEIKNLVYPESDDEGDFKLPHQTLVEHLKEQRDGLRKELSDTRQSITSKQPSDTAIGGLVSFMRDKRQQFEETDELIQQYEISDLLIARELIELNPGAANEVNIKANSLLELLQATGIPKSLWLAVLSNVERLLQDLRQQFLVGEKNEDPNN